MRHYLRQEPGAVTPLAGIRGGGRGRLRFLLRHVVRIVGSTILFSLKVIHAWEYSTTNNLPYKGKVFAASFDFSQAILDEILQRASPETSDIIRQELQNDPSTPRTIKLPTSITFGVRTRLGKLHSVEKEQFVPLVIHALLK